MEFKKLATEITEKTHLNLCGYVLYKSNDQRLFAAVIMPEVGELGEAL